jgi:hypothetical protein
MAMSLSDELVNGETFGGWSFRHAEHRESGFRRAGFCGSAAFFALLLAAATSIPADDSADAGVLASGSRLPDASGAAMHRAATPALRIAAVSKFSRRRMPLSLPTLKGRSLPA